MKILFPTLAVFLTISTSALATTPGVFEYEHEIGFGGGYTSSSCGKEGGRWKNGACFFEAVDTVELSLENEQLNVAVNTIRTNGRECAFQGAAREISPTEILASMESEASAVCELKLTFLDSDTLKVEKLDAEKCAAICGSSLVGLEIPQARRVSVAL